MSCRFSSSSRPSSIEPALREARSCPCALCAHRDRRAGCRVQLRAFVFELEGVDVDVRAELLLPPSRTPARSTYTPSPRSRVSNLLDLARRATADQERTLCTHASSSPSGSHPSHQLVYVFLAQALHITVHGSTDLPRLHASWAGLARGGQRRLVVSSWSRLRPVRAPGGPGIFGPPIPLQSRLWAGRWKSCQLA